MRDQETELTKIKKQQETLSERKKAIEKDMQVVVTADKSLNQIIKDKEGKRTKLSEELKTREDDRDEYAKTAKNILETIEPAPKKKEKATQAERATKKENLRLTFQIDELTERHRYMERKYLQLVQRVGASQEDLEAVEVLMASGRS